jgi:hypothetical protein
MQRSSVCGRTSGGPRQAGTNSVDSKPIDLPANDFARLAAIGPILRQFAVAAGLRINDAVSVRAADEHRTRAIQAIVTVELQLGVRAADAAS